ncbi:MAG: hypothetical protein IPL65_20865 [Lewinellaceae bacterium]|nr:hypothetical protein [Lewinellaceae bacterium]
MTTARIFCLLAFLGISTAISAQSYKTAVGVRLDQGVNLTLQQRLTQKWTAEGILHTSLRSDDLGLTVLAERHHKILFRGLNFYYGAGAHYYTQSNSNRLENEVSKNVSGVSFVGGAEISLGRINVGIDFMPELHLSGDTVYPLEWNRAAVSVRYILVKQKKVRLRDRLNFNKKDNKKSSKNNKKGWL